MRLRPATLRLLGGATILLITWCGVQPGPQQASASPLSASGCNGSVCIDVQGSGSQVSDWETTAWAASPTCTYANFWVNGALARQGNQQCVSGGTELRSDWTNTSFPNGTVLCNTWAGIQGKPCETIES